MDGKGAWRDNICVERLWRSVKDEEISLPAYDTVGTARASIGRSLAFNARRPHPSLGLSRPTAAASTPGPSPTIVLARAIGPDPSIPTADRLGPRGLVPRGLSYASQRPKFFT